LHGWEGLPDRRVSDLDIAVRKHHRDVLLAELAGSGSIRPVQVLEYEAGSLYVVFAPVEGGEDDLVPIDLCTDYRRDGRIFLAGDELLEGREKREGLWVAAPPVHFRYLLLKKLLKGNLPETQRRSLHRLRCDLGPAAADIERDLLGSRQGNLVEGWLAPGPGARLAGEGRTLRRLRRSARRRFTRTAWRYWPSELNRRVRRMWRPTGLSVAVLGPDGSGKTTVLEALAPTMVAAFRRTTTFHLRPGILFRGRAKGPVREPHALRPYGRIASILKHGLYAADYFAGHWLRVRWELMRSTAVFFDRYVEDFLVDPRRYRDGGPAWSRRLLARVTPGVDLLLILDAPVSHLSRRKQELSAEELRRQGMGFLDLAARSRRAVVLDGAPPAEAVACNAREIILDHLHARALRRWPRLFETPTTGPCDDGGSHTSPRRPRRGRFLPIRTPDGRRFLFPTRPRGAAAAGLQMYQAQSAVARAGRVILRSALGMGMGHAVARVPAFKSVPEPPGLTGLFERLREIHRRGDLAFAACVGASGRPGRVCVQAMTPAGEILSYAKLGTDPQGDLRVRHEHASIRAVMEARPAAFLAPEIIHGGELDGRWFFVVRPPGARLRPAPTRIDGHLIAAVLDLRRQSENEAARCALDPLVSLHSACALLPPGHLRSVCESGIRYLEDRLAGVMFPHHRSHGDLTPWNMGLLGDRLYLFDWEDSEATAPAGADLVHFIARTGLLIRNQSAGELLTALAAECRAEGLLLGYAKRLGIAASLLEPLVVLHVLRELLSLRTDHIKGRMMRHRLAKLVGLAVRGWSSQ
jgi:thymidylate kinase